MNKANSHCQNVVASTFDRVSTLQSPSSINISNFHNSFLQKLSRIFVNFIESYGKVSLFFVWKSYPIMLLPPRSFAIHTTPLQG